MFNCKRKRQRKVYKIVCEDQLNNDNKVEILEEKLNHMERYLAAQQKRDMKRSMYYKATNIGFTAELKREEKC